MDRYVMLTLTEKDGVGDVYAGPEGRGYSWEDVNEVQTILRRKLPSGTAVVIKGLRELEPPPRGRVVCAECGQSTWRAEFGCTLPGCDNHAVLVGRAPDPEPRHLAVVEEQP